MVFVTKENEARMMIKLKTPYISITCVHLFLLTLIAKLMFQRNKSFRFYSEVGWLGI